MIHAWKPTTFHRCRNGSVIIHWYDRERNNFARVHNPLYPQRGLTILPSLPRRGRNKYCIIRQALSQQDGDAMSYFYLHAESVMYAQESKFSVQVYMLQDGCWHEMFHIFDMSQLPTPRFELKSVLIDNKIYLPAVLGNIIILDLMASSVSTIQLPPGVFRYQSGTTMLSRADDVSGLYLIHAKEFHLYIWLHKGDSWTLEDTISLREMRNDLKKSGCAIEYEHTPLLMRQVVDYGDFLFLKMGGCTLQLDIKCRTLRKVYETKDGYLGDIRPFMMIWPPRFPALKYDPERSLFVL
jgi:hypothetical protein